MVKVDGYDTGVSLDGIMMAWTRFHLLINISPFLLERLLYSVRRICSRSHIVDLLDESHEWTYFISYS